MSDFDGDSSDFSISDSDDDLELQEARVKNENYLEETVPAYDEESFSKHFRVSRGVATTIAQQYEASQFYSYHSGQYGKLSGLSQQKFRQLYHVKLRNMVTITHFIRSACVLHNIALDDNFEVNENELDQENLDNQLLLEDVNVNFHEAEDDDRDAILIRNNVVNMLRFIATECKILNVSRLGKINSKNPRPLKVEFASHNEAFLVLRQKSNFPLRKFPSIKIKNDYTPTQRDELTKLYAELNRRKTNGENLRIKFSFGSPSIVPALLIELTERFPDVMIILGGDFNTRISDQDSVPIQILEGTSLFEHRLSSDTQLNTRGRHLIDFMYDNACTVLNGRSVLDRPGKYTYVSKLGHSVVDLVWVSNTSLPNINTFYVDENDFLSDHFPVHLKLNYHSPSVPSDAHGVKSNSSLFCLEWREELALTYKLFMKNSNRAHFIPDPHLAYTNLCFAIFETSDHLEPTLSIFPQV
ncbi:hypothetical protein NQ315_002687 [Exocentrus adspersus]|uniref:Endonuclease/exonuclease/phosphatase domain-containing protein n=1 Tax=Exocentrus adspersus TaxID=1586481 RepID=A0AAV8VJ19_9CUCU|nr:hypothetical protein NQ315_002687 [Exocentrus adspersus]